MSPLSIYFMHSLSVLTRDETKVLIFESFQSMKKRTSQEKDESREPVPRLDLVLWSGFYDFPKNLVFSPWVLIPKYFGFINI